MLLVTICYTLVDTHDRRAADAEGRLSMPDRLADADRLHDLNGIDFVEIASADQTGAASCISSTA